MADRTPSYHQSTTSRSTHSTPQMIPSPSAIHQHDAGRRSLKRKSSDRDHPRRLALPCSGMRNPLEDVTDVLAPAYHYLPATRPQPWNWTTGHYDVVLPSPLEWEPRTQATQYLRASAARRSSRHVHWADLDEGHDRRATPPRTPQIGRLESPKLGPLKCSGPFCDCCSDEQRYYDERGKMDSQGGCICCEWHGPSSQRVMLDD